MPVVKAFGSEFTLRIVSSKKNQVKEEFLHGEETYICAEIDEAFHITINRRIMDGDSERIRASVVLDGVKLGYSLVFTHSTIFQGWVAEETATVKKYRPFVFGAPGEEAKGRSFDALKISIKLDHVKETKRERKPIQYSLPSMDHNQVKKPFQPNVGVGEQEFVQKKPKQKKKFEYKAVGKPVDATIRYCTALGLEMKKLISPATHPHLFPDLNDDEEEEDDKKPPRKKKVNDVIDDQEEEKKPPKKKVKREVVKENDVIDLTDVKVKKEMPPRIDGEGLGGASRDDPIVLL